MTLTPKQEAFARAYVETGSQAEAYRRAYNAENTSPNAIRVNACRLMDNTNVALMIEKLQEKHQKRHEITVDKLTDMAVSAYELAMTKDVATPSAAVSAVQVFGKLHGLIVDKSKNEHTGENGAPLMPSINVTLSRNKKE